MILLGYTRTTRVRMHGRPHDPVVHPFRGRAGVPAGTGGTR